MNSEFLYQSRDNSDWTFGRNMEEILTSISTSANSKCPEEIKEQQIQQGLPIEIVCEKYPGPI
jgi:hypothetical protein